MGAVKIVGRRALIGRGFLGSTLDLPGRWTDRYHSKNIHEMSGEYDLIVIAAPGAEKWKANQVPALDIEAVWEITRAMQRSHSQRVVLLSSIDAGRDHPYGRHRQQLEDRMPEDAAILRLPALYGDGLRKNALFDLLQGKWIANQVYHWYPTSWLWGDVLNAQPGKLWTRYSAPLSMWAIAEALGKTDLVKWPYDPQKDYNEEGPYTMSSVEVLEDIVRWAKQK